MFVKHPVHRSMPRRGACPRGLHPWVAVAVALGSLAVASSVAAQPDEATRNQARDRFNAGRTAMEAENYELALTEFRAANELIPAATALYNIGLCLQKLHRDIESLVVFREFLESYPAPTGDSEREVRDRQRYQEVQNIVEGIRDTVGTVEVNVAVSGATVLVDGQLVGSAPLGHPVELVQGPHVFRAEVEGYRPAEETVRVEAGQQTAVTLIPTTMRTTAPVELSANVTDAVATLDGETLGQLPFSGDVAAGVHQLRVSAPGYETVEIAVSLEAGQPFSRSIDLAASSEDGGEEAWYEKWWVWTIAGVVVGGATAGIILGTQGETMPDSTWLRALN